ncbi:MAG: phosphoenolpyruvate--protein phosphotransferase [Planctomycetes bacterium]|nr:phosphoenolpyruvate--protein phosphotransferase [Planctomycetota bacterium]
MLKMEGVAASPGVAIGRAFVLDAEGVRIRRRYIDHDEIQHELDRFQKAMESALEDIEETESTVAENIGPDYREIFSVHKRMLQDEQLKGQIRELIADRLCTPEHAVAKTLRTYHRIFLREAKDDYLAQRVTDIHDVEHRLLRALLGQKQEDLSHLQEPVVVIAHDLTPSQTAAFDPKKILGFATNAGGKTSHSAIVARALKIPAVVGLGNVENEVSGGEMVIIDGHQGVVVIGPDTDTITRYEERGRSIHLFEAQLVKELHDLPAETLDGRRITLLANIEFPSEVKVAVELGAEGIGLYRTEFLYVGAKKPPTEREQYEAYVQTIKELAGRPAIIRTVDLGADKLWSGMQEKNPFLGCRSLRFCLRHMEMFRCQLSAILRASVLGEVSLMFPLVTSLEELREAKAVLRDVMSEMRTDGVAFNEDIRVGIMIEVPSAALTADSLAKETDFFSIGTNDLIQYTLAVDRNNQTVAQLYSPAHPAVLRLIEYVIETGRRHGIPVAICGEMGGEIDYIILLVGMGLTEFSVTPAMIPDVKKVIRSITYEEAKAIAEKAISITEATEVLRFLRKEARRVFPQHEM